MIADYSSWKDCYNRWLKIMYFNFILCCYKYNVFTHVQWKHSQTYNLFCQMMYHASSKELLSTFDRDEKFDT